LFSFVISGHDSCCAETTCVKSKTISRYFFMV
jgi:hypothetical protein